MGLRTQSPSVSHFQKQSSFFAIPAELRTEIYSYLFMHACDDGGIVSLSNCPVATPSILSILQTCKIAQKEAEELFYHSSRLYLCNADTRVHTGSLIENTDRIACFTRSTSSRRLAAIRDLTVGVSRIEEVVQVLHLSSKLIGLRSLTIWNEIVGIDSFRVYGASQIALVKEAVGMLPLTLVELQFKPVLELSRTHCKVQILPETKKASESMTPSQQLAALGLRVVAARRSKLAGAIAE